MALLLLLLVQSREQLFVPGLSAVCPPWAQQSQGQVVAACQLLMDGMKTIHGHSPLLTGDHFDDFLEVGAGDQHAIDLQDSVALAHAGHLGGPVLLDGGHLHRMFAGHCEAKAVGLPAKFE
jgi:hypothetical protein